MSPYLFLIVIEILACAVREDKIIKGFKFGEHEVRQVLYADDLTLFVKDANSINRLLIILNRLKGYFSVVSIVKSYLNLELT